MLVIFLGQLPAEIAYAIHRAGRPCGAKPERDRHELLNPAQRFLTSAGIEVAYSNVLLADLTS